jgi:hypothetical protein
MFGHLAVVNNRVCEHPDRMPKTDREAEIDSQKNALEKCETRTERTLSKKRWTKQ